MKRKDKRYPRWKKNNDKRIHEKKLKRKNKNMKEDKSEKLDRIKHAIKIKNTKTVEFNTPSNFSLIDNTVETLEFLNNIKKECKKNSKERFKIHINHTNVEEVTNDALMYLLAIINNLHLYSDKLVVIQGKKPNNESARNEFISSGFYELLETKDNFPKDRTGENFQIISANKVEPEQYKKLIDFVQDKFECVSRDTKFLFDMISELITNTVNHAYDEDSGSEFEKNWFLAAKVKNENTINITFFDIGLGIPTTVNRTFYERFGRKFAITDNKLILTALQGMNRSKTGLDYRGRGLPRIFDICNDKKVRNMKIISSKGFISLNKDVICDEIKTGIIGTLFSWDIHKNDIVIKEDTTNEDKN